MKLASVGFLGLALTLAACGEPPEERVTTQARRAVTARLIDPGSARFRNVYIVENVNLPGGGGNRRVVCGEVDGKNRAGTYVGYARFNWSDPDGALWIDNGRRANGGRDPWCTT